MRQHVIVVGGGNTANLLALWRVHGLDEVLRTAAEAGAIVSGVSAGALCWFRDGIIDSFGPRFAPLGDGLDLIPALFCPHWDCEAARQDEFRSLVRQRGLVGYAAGEGCAIHFVNGTFYEAIGEHEMAVGVRLMADRDVVREESLSVRVV